MALMCSGPPPLLIGLLVAASTAFASLAEARPQAAGQGADDRLLLDELAAYPFGAADAMTSSADGSLLFAAEGGTIAFIDASPPTQLNFRNELKRVPVGKRGVVPVEMLYEEERELLFIAGGRDGLWVMDARTDQFAQNKAWRVDDKGNQRNLLYQRSRKWCNDLERVTLGSGVSKREFLVALFAKKDDSHLCFYWLEDITQIAEAYPQDQYGNEIQPRLVVVLPARSDAPTTCPSFSYAFGMDVDPHYDPGNDKWTADIYVAMGQHGLLRVRSSAVAGVPEGVVEWGPRFGSDSGYALNHNDPLHELYEDLSFKQGSAAPYDAGKEMARHAPLFLDVAVDHRGPLAHRVFAACDHVGLVTFNLEATWSPYITGTNAGVPNFIQDGVLTPPLLGKRTVQMVDDPGNVPVRTFARRIQVVETLVDGVDAAALIVGTHRTMVTRNPGERNHGRSMDYLLRDLGGVPADLEVGTYEPGSNTFVGQRNYSIVYGLNGVNGWVTGARNCKGWTRMGPEIHAPETQANNSLTYYVTHAVDGGKLPGPTTASFDELNLARVDYDPSIGGWPPSGSSLPPTDSTHDRITFRENEYRRGRWTYRAAPSALDGNLLILGSNDAGFRADGPLTLDLRGSEPEIVANYDPGPNNVDASNSGTAGVQYEPLGAMTAMHNGTLKEYRLALGRVDLAQGTPGVENRQPRFRLQRFDLGTDIYDGTPPGSVAPHPEKTIYLQQPYGKFDEVGLYTYAGGYMNAAYDQAMVAAGHAQPGTRFAFAVLFGTPAGCWVLDMQSLRGFIDNDLLTSDGDRIVLEDSLWSSAVAGELTTHPEFWNLPDVRDLDSGATTDQNLTYGILGIAKDEDQQITQPQPGLERDRGRISGAVVTMYPEVFPWNEKWYAAVPCGAVYCDETMNGFQPGATPDLSAYVPSYPFKRSNGDGTRGFGRMMIRLFDVSDVSQVSRKPKGAWDNQNDQPILGEPSDLKPGSADVRSVTLIGPQLVDGNDMLVTGDGDYRPKGSACFDLEVHSVTDSSSNERLFCFATDMAGAVVVFELTNVFSHTLDRDAYNDGGTPGDYSDDLGDKGYLHYGATVVVDAPFASILTYDSISDGNPANAWGIEVDKVSFLDGGVQRDEVYVYVSVLRVGIEVYRFDVNAPTSASRLRRIDLIQTPGEGGFLHMWEGTPTIQDLGNHIRPPVGGTVEKLLFYADTRAGIRVFRYEQ